MRIGNFQGFKGDDAVLISCDSSEISTLRDVVREAVVLRLPVPIIERCNVSETVPAGLRLFAAIAGVFVPSAALQFVWRIDPKFHSSLDGLLEGLTGPSGHQHFYVDGKNAVLCISVGEYDENWWRDQSKRAK